MRLGLFSVMLLSACSDRPVPVPTPFDLAQPAQCVPGNYESACGSDCPDGVDPRCSTSALPVGAPCTFAGVKCDFLDFVLACDCNHVLHCTGGKCPDGVDMPCGQFTCGPSQICVEAYAISGTNDLGPVGPHYCVDNPTHCKGCGCPGYNPCLVFGVRCWQWSGRQVLCAP
jgi:hypothetical protein